jgi:predicted transcriptional regulator
MASTTDEKTKPVLIRLAPDLYDKFQEICEKEHRSKSAQGSLVISRYVEDHTKAAGRQK